MTRLPRDPEVIMRRCLVVIIACVCIIAGCVVAIILKELGAL